MTPFSYIGSELDIFSRATNWKAYYRRLIRNYIGAEVLEVGAGIGATTLTLCQGDRSRWVCLEPDPGLAEKTKQLIRSGHLPSYCEVAVGTIRDLDPAEKFDTVLYIDVLEHIKDDAEEIKLAADRLKPGGFLIVLSPAHQGLFTPFDAKIGHYRRYDKKSLSSLIPEQLDRERLFYIDAVGALASLGNRYLLQQDMPNARQIGLWDKIMIPLSRVVDPLSGFLVGKSIIGIYRKNSER
jgi:SAM-dependent methyltransferase